MGIKIEKGRKLSLAKAEPGLERLHVGLGWDLRAGGGASFDADASVFLLAEGRKVRRDDDFVFYNNKRSPCGAVAHQGDNRNGKGDGDDEVLEIDLVKLPEGVKTLVVAVTLHEADARRQHFGQLANAYIRLVNLDTGREVMRFDLGADAPRESALLFGELERQREGGWQFRAVGDGLSGGLATLAELYGVDVD